jgi:hypothetical protein
MPTKSSTLLSDRGRIEKPIKPLPGAAKVAAVTSEDIENFMHQVAEGKIAIRKKDWKKLRLSTVWSGLGSASRMVGLPGAISPALFDIGCGLTIQCAE